MFDKRDKGAVQEYIATTVMSVEPEASEITYIYLPYPTDYTQHIRMSIENNTNNALVLAVRALDAIADGREHRNAGVAYASLIRTILVGIAILDTYAIVEVEPVHNIVFDECSGLVVASLEGEPEVELYSKGDVVYHDKVGYLLLSTGD